MDHLTSLTGFDAADLLMFAREAAEATHSPYSHFPVGAVACFEKDTFHPGANIENASSGLTVCAERVAIFSGLMRHRDDRKLLAIAVSCLKGDPNDENSCMPCGACRQVIQEFATPETIVLVDKIGIFTIEDLLPRAFKLP